MSPPNLKKEAQSTCRESLMISGCLPRWWANRPQSCETQLKTKALNGRSVLLDSYSSRAVLHVVPAMVTIFKVKDIVLWLMWKSVCMCLCVCVDRSGHRFTDYRLLRVIGSSWMKARCMTSQRGLGLGLRSRSSVLSHCASVQLWLKCFCPVGGNRDVLLLSWV